MNNCYILFNKTEELFSPSCRPRLLEMQCWAMLSNAEQCWAMLSNAEQWWDMLRNTEQWPQNGPRCPKTLLRLKKFERSWSWVKAVSRAAADYVRQLKIKKGGTVREESNYWGWFVWPRWFKKGLPRLALIESDKKDNQLIAKSNIADSSPKCTEYLFPKDGCSSFIIKCCWNNS